VCPPHNISLLAEHSLTPGCLKKGAFGFKCLLDAALFIFVIFNLSVGNKNRMARSSNIGNIYFSPSNNIFKSQN